MSMTRIIYGTAWKKERTTALVVSAVLNGFRAIDTACQPKHYREDLVGEALDVLVNKHGIKREDLYIQTKYTPISGQDRSQPLPYDPQDPVYDQTHASFATSLKQLRVSYLDGYILHSPLPTLNQTLDAWTALIELQNEGKVRKIGMSNVYDPRMLDHLQLESGRAPEIVQNRWYEGNGWDPDVLNWCKKHGAQYQSFWTLTGSPSLMSHPVLNRLADVKLCTPAQTMYRFAQVLGITPLSGTTNEQHMREAIEAEKIEMTSNDVKELVQFLQS